MSMPSSTVSSNTSTAVVIASFLVITAVQSVAGFAPLVQRIHAPAVTTCSARPDNSDKWEREIDENVMRRLQREPEKANGLGETAAGAVLGGLLLGPFGALFGASIGSNLGAQTSVQRLRAEEMQNMGLTPEVLEMARSVGFALEQSIDGLEASKESLQTQQRLAKRVDADVTSFYDKAMVAIKDGDEESARKLLMKRTQLQDQLKSVLLNCAEEKKRLEKMETNVAELQRRALEVESLVKRAVSSKTMQSTADFSLAAEDPLLQKFKDMGID